LYVQVDSLGIFPICISNWNMCEICSFKTSLQVFFLFTRRDDFSIIQFKAEFVLIIVKLAAFHSFLHAKFQTFVQSFSITSLKILTLTAQLFMQRNLQRLNMNENCRKGSDPGNNGMKFGLYQ